MGEEASEAVILGISSGASAGRGAAGLWEHSETWGICVPGLCPSSTTLHHHLPPLQQNGANAVISRTPNSRQGQLQDVIGLRIPRKSPSLPYKLPLCTSPHTAPHSMSTILLGAIRSFGVNQKAHQTPLKNFEKHRF